MVELPSFWQFLFFSPFLSLFFPHLLGHMPGRPMPPSLSQCYCVWSHIYTHLWPEYTVHLGKLGRTHWLSASQSLGWVVCAFEHLRHKQTKVECIDNKVDNFSAVTPTWQYIYFLSALRILTSYPGFSYISHYQCTLHFKENFARYQIFYIFLYWYLTVIISKVETRNSLNFLLC